MEDQKVIRYYVEHFPRLYRGVDNFSGCDVNSIREVILEPIDNLNLFKFVNIKSKYWRGFGERLYESLLNTISERDRLKKEKVNAQLCGILEIKMLNVVRKKENIEELVLH